MQAKIGYPLLPGKSGKKELEIATWPHVVEHWDYSSEEVIYQRLRTLYPVEWGDGEPESVSTEVGFYNTMLVWPLLSFGWDLFLKCSLDPRFEPVMDEFAEINRRVFSAFARWLVHFVICHDDIVMTRSPICSPRWMRKYIFLRYEEFWSIVKSAGKQVIFMSDGCMNVYADDVMAFGAIGIISEPYTDYQKLARRYPDSFLAGEGDNRVLSRNDAAEIRTMVESMTETGRMSRGYMMCIGNYIPCDIPPQAIKRYLDLPAELAVR